MAKGVPHTRRRRRHLALTLALTFTLSPSPLTSHRSPSPSPLLHPHPHRYAQERLSDATSKLAESKENVDRLQNEMRAVSAQLTKERNTGQQQRDAAQQAQRKFNETQVSEDARK